MKVFVGRLRRLLRGEQVHTDKYKFALLRTRRRFHTVMTRRVSTITGKSRRITIGHNWSLFGWTLVLRSIPNSHGPDFSGGTE